jgi:4'-phosphopantetheinyl transferase
MQDVSIGIGYNMERIPDVATLPPPVGQAVDVWWAQVDVGHFPPHTRMALAADIDAARLAKLDRFRRVEDRDRGLAAHALLRRLLAAVVGGKPSEIVLKTRCASCGKTDHGKPYLDTGQGTSPVELNISHSGQIVAVALAAPGVNIGVDVEQRRMVEWVTLRRSVFTDAEWLDTESHADPSRRRMDAWARKESSVKASGHGLSLPLREVRAYDLEGGGWTSVLPRSAGYVAGVDLPLTADVAAAVAVQDSTPPPALTSPVVREVRID